MNIGQQPNTTTSTQPFNSFSAQNKYAINPTSEFIDSNSLVAKVAFLLLVLLGFVVILRLSITVLSYFITQASNPHLIDGMVEADQMIVIPQDPSTSGSVVIPRSVNATDGIEFTWSVWVFIDNLTHNAGKYKCVFYKGNTYASDPNATPSEQKEQLGLNFPNNAPGLYIAPNTNNMVVIMNTYNVINEQIIIEDVPLNKWFNVIIRCQNTTLDVYINGTILKSHQLHGVPKQNYGDVYIAPNGGFAGNIADLWYYSYALGVREIIKLAERGPNTDSASTSSTLTSQTNYDYLSLRWFFNGVNGSTATA